VLAWLHEDCDAGLLAPADQDLVRTHVPWTACLGLNEDPAAQPNLLRKAPDERDRLIVKPAVGKSGNGVLFGSQTSDEDWLPALVRTARDTPLVLQRRVEPDSVAMPFLDQTPGSSSLYRCRSCSARSSSTAQGRVSGAPLGSRRPEPARGDRSASSPRFSS
jgi:hypothetical protein